MLVTFYSTPEYSETSGMTPCFFFTNLLVYDMSTYMNFPHFVGTLDPGDLSVILTLLNSAPGAGPAEEQFPKFYPQCPCPGDIL